MARNLAMTVLMNVDIYDKTKYLESAVFVFVRGVILSISVIQCDHNIDINPSPGLLTQLEPMTKSQLQRPILYRVKLFLGSDCCHSKLIEAGHECSCLESDKASFWSHLYFI